MVYPNNHNNRRGNQNNRRRNYDYPYSNNEGFMQNDSPGMRNYNMQNNSPNMRNDYGRPNYDRRNYDRRNDFNRSINNRRHEFQNRNNYRKNEFQNRNKYNNNDDSHIDRGFLNRNQNRPQSQTQKVKNNISDGLEMEIIFDNPNNKNGEKKVGTDDKPESIIIPLDDSGTLDKPTQSGNLLGMIVQKMISVNMENDKEKESEEEEQEVEVKPDTREFRVISDKIDSLDDLIPLGKEGSEKYSDPNIRYNIDINIIKELVEPLENFNKLIGLDGVKKQILLQLLFYLQKLDTKNKDMLHTVIEGSPGVGKTELAKLLATVYNKMGILKKNKFKIVKRHDLIGGYLGQTAQKTNKVLEEAKGGVLFIDEAYSLGNEENKDSYAKECIDTITSFLSENRGDFVCIIAGYKEGLEKCFFKYNEGLERRFTWRYKIDDYTNEELKDIFLQIVKKGDWDYVNEETFLEFFDKNRKYFKFNGGDMETLFHKCKLVHSKRVIHCHIDEKKKLNIDDLNDGLELFMDENIKKRNEQINASIQHLYL